MFSLRDIHFGTDPEVFAVYEGPVGKETKHNSWAMSPANFWRDLGMTPVDVDVAGENKHPVYIETPQYRWIGDGAAFELNMRRPYGSNELKTFYNDINTARTHLTDVLGNRGFSVFEKPVVNFDADKFWVPNLAEDMALFWGTIFGCDKDEDAFNVDWLCEIQDQSTHDKRYGGGHIHTSCPSLMTNYLYSVKMMALLVGNYVNSNSPNKELEPLRAQYYGKPGKYRLQKYPNGEQGIEYRTPSNSWLGFDYPQFETMLHYMIRVCELSEDEKRCEDMIETYGDETVKAITSANADASQTILEEMGE